MQADTFQWFLVNDQRDAQFFSMYLFIFLTLKMFRAHRAHHQERQIVPIQPLVAVTLCRWLCRVQVGSELPTCTRHSHRQRLTATGGNTVFKNPNKYLFMYVLVIGVFKYRITSIKDAPFSHTGRFIMFSVITNIYNKKTKWLTLMELFTATGKLKKFFFFKYN